MKEKLVKLMPGALLFHIILKSRLFSVAEVSCWLFIIFMPEKF